MATETESKKVARPEVRMEPHAAPQILGDDNEHLYVSPHDMSENVDPNYAGDYELTHGVLRVPVQDGKGDFVQRGRVYRTGAKMRLNAIDAYRFLDAGVVKRIDGRMPDRVKPEADAHAAE